MKLRCIEKHFASITFGKVYDVIKKDKSYIWIMNDKGQEHQFDTIENYFEVVTDNAPSYYNNEKGSLYKLAKERGWNAYVYEVVKRLDRAEKKGEFISDIKKSIHVLELYLQEQQEEFKGQIEVLNKK